MGVENRHLNIFQFLKIYLPYAAAAAKLLQSCPTLGP